MLRILPLLVAALACGCAVSPEPTRIERGELAPTGVLRVAVFTGNPAVGTSERLYGQPLGTAASLGRELSLHTRLPVRLIDYPAEDKLLEDAARGAWDVAALACQPERTSALEYTPAYLLVGARGGAQIGVCLVVPAGRGAARDYVAGFVKRAKSQGAVARAIADAGLQGAQVAP